MDKREKIGRFVSEAGKTARGLIDSAVQAVDQNDDGRLDFADVSVVAESMGNAVKQGALTMMETAEEKLRQHELKILQPIFEDTLVEASFRLSKIIRIVERDKRYIDSSVCKGAIGHILEQKGLQIVNVFRDSTEAFGVTFYPDCDCDFYYVDPSDRDRYIALDEYFYYLKIARVNELQKLAQDLGAKYFKVTYKEEKATFSDNKVKVHAKAAAAADVDHQATEKKYSTVEVAAEMSFPGHEPIRPELKYLQRDPSIQTLISMRMDEKAPLLHQKFMLKMSNSSGIKESDAVKIDALLKGLKCSGNTTVASEARNESRRYLEYDIEF